MLTHLALRTAEIFGKLIQKKELSPFITLSESRQIKARTVFGICLTYQLAICSKDIVVRLLKNFKVYIRATGTDFGLYPSDVLPTIAALAS